MIYYFTTWVPDREWTDRLAGVMVYTDQRTHKVVKVWYEPNGTMQYSPQQTPLENLTFPP